MILLDLFCGAGGAGMGYNRAGFEVIGVDINPQPNYPFQFIQADWQEVIGMVHADVIHASPPCQSYSAMSQCRPGLSSTYPDLIDEVRSALQRTGIPWVIENVPGAPLNNPVVLCGRMFGLDLYRHRLFETSFPGLQPWHPPHNKPASRAGHWEPGTVMSVAGHFSPVAHARKIMDIDWMTRDEMREAIPPAYTAWIGFSYTNWGKRLGAGLTHQHP